MKEIIERPDGTRAVRISFPADEPASVHMTKPEFAKESDINRIMAKYQRTGILGDPLAYKQGVYGDFTSANDFSEAMRKIAAVENLFDSLPSDIRSRFENDPAKLIDFVNDPANEAEAVKMRLKLPSTPEFTPAPVVVPPAAPPAAPVPAGIPVPAAPVA